MQVQLQGLDALVEQKVREVVAEMLGSKPEEDPWLNSDAAAQYLGVSRQRIHDLSSTGRLRRYGEKGERLYFRRSDLDRYMETRGRS
jgi:excisionase family DNA binding protein